jgi:hypothetical protein
MTSAISMRRRRGVLDMGSTLVVPGVSAKCRRGTEQLRVAWFTHSAHADAHTLTQHPRRSIDEYGAPARHVTGLT